MKKENDGKDKYRKKKYTPKRTPPRLNKASIQLKLQYEWLLKCKQKAELQGDKTDKRKCELMIDLANKGVNIAEIGKVLAHIPFNWKEKTGILDMTMDLSKEKYLEYFNKVEKPVRNAFTLLTKGILPVFPDCNQALCINREIIKMQSELKKYEWIIKEYFKLRLYELCFEALMKSYNYTEDGVEKDVNLAAIRKLISPDELKEMLLKKIKPARQSCHNLWNKAKLSIMNELEKIGYSKKQSQKITADLLNLFYPDIYKDKDPDLIKSTCSYHKKKAKE